MYNKWLKVALIFSLAVNVAILGAFGYPVARQYFKAGSETALIPGYSLENIPSQVLSSRAAFEKGLFEERALVQLQQNELAQLLMQQPPDKEKIQEKVKLLNAQQEKIQQAVVAQILSETSSMTPEQKSLYLSSIQGRMCQPGMMGRCGKGRGFRGGMGFGRNRSCQ